MGFSQFFIHPWMAAAGVSLIAIPIIIHLLNRLRYRVVRFAAMEFLLQSEQKNRRRILLEQLLLLLLRILIVLMVVALFARLLLDPSQLSLLEENETHHIVMLDDSGSMRDRWGETSAYQEALTTLKRLTSELAAAGGNHSLTLLQSSAPDRSLPSLTQRRIDRSLVSELEDKLESMSKACGYGQADWTAVFGAIQRQLTAGSSGFRVVHVLSDFRAREWAQAPNLKQDLESLIDEQTLINLVPVVPARHQNLGITNFQGNLNIAAVGVPVELSLTIENFGETVIEDVAVRVLVNGEPIPQSITIPKIDPGESLEERFEVTLTTPGEHDLVVTIPADALESDNSRFLTINVPERQRILVADGTEETRDAEYVADALAADPQITGFDVVIIRPESLREQDLDSFTMIYLMNVDRLLPDVVKHLQDYVTAGGGLAWFMGDQIDYLFYNQLFESSHGDETSINSDANAAEETESEQTLEGQSLFPLQIAASPIELPPSDETSPGADLELEAHPLFEILNAEDGLLAYFLKIYRFYPLADEFDDSKVATQFRVLGRLRNQSPLFLETRLGEGRIFISLTSAGPMSLNEESRWHNWPFDINAPGFTVFHLELAKYLANRRNSRPPRFVNQPLLIDINPGLAMPDVRINPPEASGMNAVTMTATRPSQEQIEDDPETEGAVLQDDMLLAEYKQTRGPGIYRVTTEDLNRNATTKLYAYNVPASESSLATFPADEIRQKLAGLSGVLVQDFGELNGVTRNDPGRELRYLLLLCIVGLFMAEQWLAFRLGFHSQDRFHTSQAGSSTTRWTQSGPMAARTLSSQQEVQL